MQGANAAALLLAVTCCVSSAAAAAAATEACDAKPAFLLSSYVPEYRLGHVTDNLARIAPYLNEVILFSVSPAEDGAVVHEPGIAAADLTSFAARAREAGVQRVLVSVGGGGRSAEFRSVAQLPKVRKVFVRTLAKLCDTHGLDGVDIDWEAPQTPAHRAALAKLLAELRTALGAARTLTVALHFWDNLEAAALPHIDRINFMTYDFDRAPGGHASFRATKQAVQNLLAAGVPAAKIAVGVPAYARSKAGDVKTVSELHDRFAAKLADEAAGQAGGYFFNGRGQCRKKVRWAKELGLAGIFMWEVGQDSLEEGRSLLQALHEEAVGGADE